MNSHYFSNNLIIEDIHGYLVQGLVAQHLCPEGFIVHVESITVAWLVQHAKRVALATARSAEPEPSTTQLTTVHARLAVSVIRFTAEARVSHLLLFCFTQ